MRRQQVPQDYHQREPRADCPRCTKGMERKPRPKQATYMDVGNMEIPSETTTLTLPAAGYGFDATTAVYPPVVLISPPNAERTLDFINEQREPDKVARLEQQLREKDSELDAQRIQLDELDYVRDQLVMARLTLEQEFEIEHKRGLRVLEANISSKRKEIESLESQEREIKARKRMLEDEKMKLLKQLEKEKKRLPKQPMETEAEEQAKKKGGSWISSIPWQTQRGREKTQSTHMSPIVEATEPSTPAVPSSERLDNPSELEVETHPSGEVDTQQNSLSVVPVHRQTSNDSISVGGTE